MGLFHSRDLFQEEASQVQQTMGSEDEALIVQSKRTDHHKSKHPHPRISNKKLPKFKCYTCDEIGHYARNYPKNKSGSHKKKVNKRRHHAHTAEDDEPPKKRAKQESDDSSSDEEYVLIFALTGTISHGSNARLIDSGASKHMTGFKESFVKLSKHESPHNVKLGDDYQYRIKVVVNPPTS